MQVDLLERPSGSGVGSKSEWNREQNQPAKSQGMFKFLPAFVSCECLPVAG